METDTHRKLELGNLICKFGHENLIDHLHTIFLPAISKSEKFIFRGTPYRIIDLEVVGTADARSIVAFRLIAHKELHSEQKFDENSEELERVDESLKTAPTCLVVITFPDHRIMVASEATWAAGMSTVGAVLRHLVVERFDEYIEERGASMSHGDRTTGKRELRDRLKPSLHIHQFIDTNTLKDRVFSFSTLKLLTVTITHPNSEKDTSGMFEDVQGQAVEMNAPKARVTFSNKDGLDREAVYKQASEATKLGGATLKLKGDRGSTKDVAYNSDSVAVTASVENTSGLSMRRVIQRLMKTLTKLEESGAVPYRDIPGVRLLETFKLFGKKNGK